MPKVSEEHRRRRRARIVAAAMECFSRTGIQGTPVTDIIEASGMSAGTVYAHFPGGKDDLAVAAAVDTVRALSERILRGDFSDPVETVDALIDEWAWHRPLLAMIMALWAEATVRPELARVLAEHVGRAHGTVRERLTEWCVAAGGDPEDAARWASGMTDVVRTVLSGTLPRIAIWRSTVDIADQRATVRRVLTAELASAPLPRG